MRAPVTIMLLQAGPPEPLFEAARAAARRYPGAKLTGFVQAHDRQAVQATGLFAEVRCADELGHDEAVRMAQSFELCVVPFGDRLGVRYWHARMAAYGLGIARLASHNRRDVFVEYGRLGWLWQTLLICWVFRAIHQPALWAWGYLRRVLDAGALFALALLTSPLHWFSTAGLHPFGRTAIRQGAHGRRRAVFFIPSLGLGGAQRQLVAILRHLDRSKWEPEVVTLDVPDKFFEPAVRALGVPLIYLNDRSDFWYVEIIWRLARRLMAHPAHVLHSWLHYAAMLGAVAGTIAGTPVVIGSLRSQRPSRFPWFYPKWQRGIDLITARVQTTIIANSQAVRDENQAWALIPDSKLLTIYNGIDETIMAHPGGAQVEQLRAALGIPAEAPVVGMVGRLFPEKDHATFLRAAERVIAQRPDARFIIVGEGVLRDRIAAEVRRAGLEGRVLLLGARQDVPDLLALLQVFVLTSTTEGFPNVLLEAAAAGVPTVTTAAGGAAEVVLDGSTGFVVPCGDAEQVAARVLALLDDATLRTRFAEAARDRVRTVFSAEAAARAVEACYDRALASRSCRAGWPASRRLCFISRYAGNFLEPRAGGPIGGAEVQMGTLARLLAGHPGLDVTLLTAADHVGNRQQGVLAIRTSRLFGGAGDSTAAHMAAPAVVSRQAARPDFADNTAPAPGKADRLWLRRLPGPVAGSLRAMVRAWYACRRPIMQSLAPWQVRLRESWQEAVRLWRWGQAVRSANADLYVLRCASPELGYVTAWCRLLGRRVLFMVAHDDDVSGDYARREPRWGRRYEWGLRRADTIVCQHQGQVEWLRNVYGREGMVMRSLCPLPAATVPQSERQGVLWMARLVAWKQPELCLDLAEALPHESFTLVGPVGDWPGIDRFRERLDRLVNVRWLPGVAFEETAALFARAKLFVNTSSVEGFPNTFLQAAVNGTPVVAWTVDPDRVLERFGFGQCAAGDWDTFERIVRELSGAAALRQRLGENGRRYVAEHHDPTALASAYADVFLTMETQGTRRVSPAAVSVPVPR